MLPRATVILGLDSGGSASTLTHMAVERLQKPHFKAYYLAVDRLQALVGSWPETSVPCPVSLSIRHLTTWQLAFLRAREGESEQNGKQVRERRTLVQESVMAR